jgi:hypothetical protein
MYWSDKLGKTQPRLLSCIFEITAAKTATPVVKGLPALHLFDAASNQAQIDGFLGTTSEFLAAAFDATAMGSDAFACIVNMGGQAADLVAMTARCYSGTAGATLVEAMVGNTGLTASTLATEAALGADGNLAARVDFGNSPDFDGLTAGYIFVDFLWIAK